MPSSNAKCQIQKVVIVLARLVGDRVDSVAWLTGVNHRLRGVEWRTRFDDAPLKLESIYPKIIL